MSQLIIGPPPVLHEIETARRDSQPGQSMAPAPRIRPKLRRTLVLLDIVALATAWIVALTVQASGFRLSTVHEPSTVLGLATMGSLVGLAALVMQQLYLARVCAVRAVELSRLGRVAAVSATLVALGAPLVLETRVATGRLLLAGGLTFVALSVVRGFFARWLKSRRTEGSFGRVVVIVGANEDGFEVSELLKSHPELGYRVVGVVGDRAEAERWDPEVPWLGRSGDALDVVRAHGAEGVVVVASAMVCAERNRLIRDCLEARVHVHLASGVSGMDYRRVRPLPLAHEPFFYVEPTSLRRWQVAVKRTIDLGLALVGLILATPIIVGAAVAIKLCDRGPIIFRQERVGRDHLPFTLYKLRTMVPDAAACLDDVIGLNQRDGGPLFKADHDPRVTRIGHFLRSTSIDELPQLINVLRGHMSLVGPRPALPKEVAQFDEALLGRLKVRPGITGLWQVEARDNPSYYAYRRLDLFYVDNWSPVFDLVILVQTVQAVLGRGTRSVIRGALKTRGTAIPPVALVEGVPIEGG